MDLKRKFLGVVLLLSFSFAIGEEADLAREKFAEIRRLVATSAPAGFENLSVTEKEELIAAGNRELQEDMKASELVASNSEFVDPNIRITLSGLGDKQAAEHIASELERNHELIEFHHSHAINGGPALIEALAKRIFRAEPFEIGGSDSAYFPPSHNAAVGMLATLRHAPQFDLSVRRWALEFENAPSGDEVRAIVREWWRENEPLFKAQRYSEVKPGRPRPSSLDVPPAVMTPAEPPEPPQAQEPPVEAASPAGVGQASPSNRTNGLLLGALGLALAIAGLVFFRKRRT